MTSFYPVVAVVAAAVWAALLFNHPRTRVPLLYGLGAVLIASSAGVLAGPLTGVAARPAGVALIALAALTTPLTEGTGSPRLAGRLALSICAPLAVYVLVATAPHGQWPEFALYLAALGLPVILIVSTGGHLAPPDLQRGLFLGLSLTVGGSLVFGLLRPDLGIEGERLRGLLENANSLGFIAFLLGATAILVPSRWSRPCLALSAIALIWTASRASALALVLVGLFELLRRKRYGLVGALGAAVVLAAILLTRLDVPGVPLEGLLRTTDSRSNSLDAALDDFRSSPLWGIGLGNESAIIASSPFRALSNGGLLGFLCVALQGVLIFRASLVNGRATVFAAAALVHSVFEGWLLSPSSPFLLLFAGTWLLIARTAPEPTGTRPRASTRELRRPSTEVRAQ
ncbi:O-antigen ligase family protein [Georgenia sp. H159]|uniref:O-antigen ligase family protein n=1 Tax=Georgenia sp. H159 TaxID=3076115 RepID=UPI002D7749ED|nr:O-antigen ligase family protein [Georgenia sp. H159]